MLFGSQVGVFKEPSKLVPNDRFGSLAAAQHSTVPMAGIGRKADIRLAQLLAMQSAVSNLAERVSATLQYYSVSREPRKYYNVNKIQSCVFQFVSGNVVRSYIHL